ncbi:hypothetical protein IGJ28_000193 [Enterococcus sp. AZ091]|uniref:hypothetical protein n=1 Tax=Enterococcus gallinarum TaxID=1353 RepID=UPI002091ADED|nr:hypothetical protein [Enterococcus gallinarum]MCO5478280.1 hypothetical protein [Enterococcus gallinarum]
MFITSNRGCYNSYYVPFHTMAHASWPPMYVRCECWKYRLKTSNQIDFYIRKIVVPADDKKTTTFQK